ncbi:MAG: DsbA family protein [Longimicrobiales bacterium]
MRIASRWQGHIDLLTVALTLCAVAIAGAALVRVQQSGTRPNQKESSRLIGSWTQLSEGPRTLGDPRAPFRIVVFTDYQCEACAVLNQHLHDLQSMYPLVVIHRHLPLERVHASAFGAAVATLIL